MTEPTAHAELCTECGRWSESVYAQQTMIARQERDAARAQAAYWRGEALGAYKAEERLLARNYEWVVGKRQAIEAQIAAETGS